MLYDLRLIIYFLENVLALHCEYITCYNVLSNHARSVIVRGLIKSIRYMNRLQQCLMDFKSDWYFSGDKCYLVHHLLLKHFYFTLNSSIDFES